MDGPTEGGGSSGEMYLYNYKVGKTIGHGSFGKVKIAEHVLTGCHVAIKILNRHKMNQAHMKEKVQREIKISRILEHPHIVRIYEVIETQTDVYIVMEYMKRGELFDYIVEKGRIQENEAQNLFQQIISGVEYCHKNMVAHRDLKPENLLLDSSGNVKIADFGLSNIIRNGHLLKTSCGSPNYVAPEVISGKLYSGPEADVWSCGIILYALLCGKLPFDDGNFASLFKKIKAGIYTLPSHLSPGARDLIPRMLSVDPLKRMTIPEIRQHPWFKVCLPRNLAVPLSDLKPQIDEEILHEVLRKGFNLNQLVESLQNRIQNEATVAYHLLLDKRSSVSSGYLGTEIQESMECGSADIFKDDVLHGTAGHNFPEKASCWQKLPSQSKWHLGIQSPAPPHELMMQVLGTLKELNVCWKKIGHYNVKCHWIHGFFHPKASSFGHNNHYQDDGESTIVKFEIQLYRASEDKYLLDLKRVGGSQLLFLDLCAVFMMQLETH